MSKRLQVVMDEREYRELERDARRHGVTVSEWVRQALRTVRRESSVGDRAHKLAAIRAAARHEFPAPDIDKMLAEIEQGYLA